VSLLHQIGLEEDLPMEFIDLRSDTVTNPGPEMRQAMAQAEVGEELYREDPTVNALQVSVAQLLGHEAALFVPSGTMGNLIALKVHTQPGEEVILEARSHIYNNEMGGLSAFCGLVARPVCGDSTGMISWKQVRQHIRPPHRSRTCLVSLENTHNTASGGILPQSEVEVLCWHLRELDIPVHLDGARLGNASAATGKPLAELAGSCDSVMFDFSKALGAPAGAVLAGNIEFIERARRLRKLLGGEIHQPGILAAACLYGLEHHLPRLPEDHRKAKRLARGLAEISGIAVDPESVATNIVIFRLHPARNPKQFVSGLRNRGVLATSLEDGRLRFVTHLNVSDADIDAAIGAAGDSMKELT
jgi:threonine aldolase